MFELLPALASCLVLLGAVLAMVSVWIIRHSDRDKRRDHLARSLVAAGVSLISIGVAVLIYNFTLRRQQDVDALERLMIAQRFYWATLQYGTVAYQLRSTQYYCGMDPDQGSVSTNSHYDRGACRESAEFTKNTSALLPRTELIMDQAGKNSHAFSDSVRIATFIMDGDIALRGRVPAIIQTNLGAYLDQRKNPNVREKFPSELRELQENAEATAAIFCIFKNEIKISWGEFDRVVKELEAGISEPSLYPEAVRERAQKSPFAKSHCANVRQELEQLLPATGGGNGGGG
ncbi:hypothetical protein [Bradyrhizobium prioriisuperbiae]|uniref:hypothetical protein n=1 Tax=Bradyrhizobium prioriisuperbiae TaxID=2854389 RepID=UPI0028E7F01E|nr:hypothetical protein [Bradyrhizobium prioritasuperba]